MPLLRRHHHPTTSATGGWGMMWLCRKWCEWWHVDNWRGFRPCDAEPTKIFMECQKCHRIWRARTGL